MGMNISEAVMSMKISDYQSVRKDMKPGDIIAFSGKGDVSNIIKKVTRSTVSHIGIILQTVERNMTGGAEEETERYFNQIIESTSIQDFDGVMVSRLSNRIANYDGEVWWLPLRKDLRQNQKALKIFYNFLFSQVGKGYDTIQAIKSALEGLDKLSFLNVCSTYNKEDFSKFFGSELAAAALEEAGVVPSLNASEVTPIDLCRWNIYQDKYYLLKCDCYTPEDKKFITRYNSLDPAFWNY